jgi:catechol 2,3-dioxygenase-like lactoylglutathione lyase family enzyme
MTETPRIECEQMNPGMVVRDVVAAVEFYTKKLGFKVSFTWGEPPAFAGVMLDKVQIFLQPGAPAGSPVYFHVGDADALYAFHQAMGVEVESEIGDRDYGIRDYTVRDLDGNHLTFGHPLFNMGEPIPIERVDVPVRLEKRLAALLEDLAKHKRMSVSSCLEEVLLHTNEPFGDGVASPHTKGQLAYIQELKKKHGIDYDSHGSYRFVEK